jgi:hypothetical protein
MLFARTFSILYNESKHITEDHDEEKTEKAATYHSDRCHTDRFNLFVEYVFVEHGRVLLKE